LPAPKSAASSSSDEGVASLDSGASRQALGASDSIGLSVDLPAELARHRAVREPREAAHDLAMVPNSAYHFYERRFVPSRSRY
jgi:hypothetical protein